MILYHGSNAEVRLPRILTTNRSLDFGAGFYTTSSLNQAERWAQLQTRRRGNGRAAVSAYEMDESAIESLSLLRFEGADAAWLDFVVENRKGLYKGELYDLVIGPVANDRTMSVINDYMNALRLFLASETRSMLLDDDLKMWHFSPLAIFDMWENEQAMGDPRNSLYLRGDEIA